MRTAAPGPPAAGQGRLAEALAMIRFSHTLFALPFALTGMVLAARGLPPVGVVFWIVVAMVAGRTAAMTFNRLVDRRLDAANPRTAHRALATGRLPPGFAWSVFAVHRLLMWEIPLLGAGFAAKRLAASLVLPPIAALIAVLILSV